MTTLTPTRPDVQQDTADPWGGRLVAAALVALPVVTTALVLMLPADALTRAVDKASATKALDAAAAHRTGAWVGGLLIGVLYLLMLPALQAVLRGVPARGRALVRVGYVLASVGACALAVEDAVVGVSLRAATASGLDKAQSASYLIELQKEGGPLSPLLWGAGLFFVGVVVLAIGILRSGTLGWWHALVVVLACFGLVATGPGVTGVIEVALLVAMAVAFLRPTRE